ncbi:AbrB/MazE/SpoVT family DNA-binding domain-containing protein [Candidatus Poribacteria bacterium]|nr:AbrB/MazE/SpoVT family DNA-binding domain-containing protein [Candidatus Poribacteria bacterium]
MAGKKAPQPCGPGSMLGESVRCCKVEALIPIDARGQIVLPKDLREKAGIKAGDKLAVVSFESDGQVCCFALVKADALAGTVKDMLGPIMKDIF